MTDNRSTLRQQIRTHRRAIDKHARLAAAEALAERLLTLPFAPNPVRWRVT